MESGLRSNPTLTLLPRLAAKGCSTSRFWPTSLFLNRSWSTNCAVSLITPKWRVSSACGLIKCSEERMSHYSWSSSPLRQRGQWPRKLFPHFFTTCASSVLIWKLSPSCLAPLSMKGKSAVTARVVLARQNAFLRLWGIRSTVRLGNSHLQQISSLRRKKYHESDTSDT